MSSEQRILQPFGWAPPSGYSNGISASGRTIVVAGQVGWDAQKRLVSADLVEQARQALENIVAILAVDGARPEHIVRLTWYLTSRTAFVGASEALGVAYREVMGRHFPAMTAIEVSSLIEKDAVVEIEATAIVPDA